MKKVKQFLPIILLAFLPMLGTAMTETELRLFMPSIFLSWGILLSPFYALISSLVVGTETPVFGIMWLGFFNGEYEIRAEYGWIDYYQIGLWIFYTVGVAMALLAFFLGKRKGALILCHTMVAAFLPYELLIATYTRVGLLQKIYLFVSAFACLFYFGYLIHRWFRFEEEKKWLGFFKRAYPIVLLCLLPTVATDFSALRFFGLTTPMILLSWGFLFCPLYTGVVAKLYGHSIVMHEFLMPYSIFATNEKWSQLAFGLMGYARLFLLIYTVLIGLALFYLLRRKYRVANSLRDLLLGICVPYEVLFIVVANVSLGSKIYAGVVACLIVAHLVYRWIEKKKEKKA